MKFFWAAINKQFLDVLKSAAFGEKNPVRQIVCCFRIFARKILENILYLQTFY